MRLFYLLLIASPFALMGDCFFSEVRVGSFTPASHSIRKIYKETIVEYEVETGLQLLGCLQAWLNVSGFKQKGHSVGMGDKTTLQIYPISFGFKYLTPISRQFYNYLGIGASYSWITCCDQTPFMQQRIHKKNWGYVTKAGFLYCVSNTLIFDLFGDYYYTKVSMPTGSIDVGGLRAGLGIGLLF